uniref:Fatty acid amide hydrolase n=1 Tax=Acanthochromis polyacanthus TaxID=80966 RepID=A0A3Q1GXV8_9TELE
MEDVKRFLREAKLDSWTAALPTVVAGVGALLVLMRTVSNHREAKEKIRRARNRRTESLRRAEEAVLRYKQSHPTADLTPILKLSLSELTKELHEGSLNPEEALNAFMEKTLAVHKKLNCCAEILLESFDQLETVGSNKEGLLYGVPVSIKDNCGYKGHDSSCGVLLYLEKPVQEDAVLVQVLKKQGAIPFVKTNIPQGLLSYDCSNPIYGQTVNPHNLQKTSGGSSGGEAALIGGGGSLLGIGSDLGGSIRIPASFCGICGFKPTSGPAKSRELARCSVCVCETPPGIYQSTKPLRIGYLENNGFQQPSPSMVRSVREVRALLEQAGHTFVPFQPLRVKETFYELMFKGTYADGTATLLWEQHAAVEDYIKETIAHWRKCDIDVLLCPVIAPAYNFFYTGKNTAMLSYTWLYNLLNFPAGVVPVTTVTKEDEEELKHYQGIYQDEYDKFFKEVNLSINAI